MTEPAPAEAPPERLHPLFLLTGLGGSLRGAAGGYAFIAYLFVSGRSGTALLLAVVLLAFLLLSLFVYWTRFEFRVGTSDIRIDSGLLSRTHRSIPFDRIQDVDIAQGPVARLLGLAKVKFETGSAGTNEDEGVLQAIRLERAQELRALIRSHRAGEAALDTAASAEEQPACVYAMSLRRVLLAGLFNFSLALFAGLAGLTQTFGDVLGFDPFSRAFWLQLLSAGDPIADLLLANRELAAVAGLALLVLIGIVTGVVRTLLRDYGFRIERSGPGLRRRRGLLTVTDVTLPIRRIQAAIVATGPVRDAFGWRELKLQSLARDEGGSGDHVVAPLAREDEVDALIAQVGWRPVAAAPGWTRLDPAYVWIMALLLAPLAVIGLVELALIPLAGIALTAAVAAVMLLRWLEWRRAGYVMEDDRLLVRSGWWRRRVLVLPLRRIQSVDLTQSVVSRWFGVAGLTLGVAGGSGFAGHRIATVRSETAVELREQLLSSVA